MSNKFLSSNTALSLAINGCSQGIGLFLAKHFKSRHEVTEVTARLPDFDEILSEIENCDVFINNASDRLFQTELFLHVYKHWRLNEGKFIINIGSRASALNSSINTMYSVSKNALNFAVANCLYKDKEKACRISVINLGLVGKIQNMSLGFDDVVDAVETVLYAPSAVEIARIDVHHRAAYPIVQESKKRLETNVDFKVY